MKVRHKKFFHNNSKTENHLLIISSTFRCSVEIDSNGKAVVGLTVSESSPSTSTTESKRGMDLNEDATPSTSTPTNITSDAQREDSDTPTECSRTETEEEEEEEETDKSSTMEEVCIFCKKKQRMHKRNFVPLSVSMSELAIKKIKETATELDDVELLQDIEVIMAVRGSLLYHNYCKCQYEAKLRAQIRAQKEPSDYLKNRTMHATAMDYVYGYVEEHVVQGGRPLLMDTLHFIYKTRMMDEVKRRDLNIEVNPTNRNVEQNLLSVFKGKIVFDHVGNRKFVKPINSTVEIDLAELQEEADIHRVGIIVRRSIDNEARKLGDTNSVQNSLDGEFHVPNKLLLLIQSIAKDPVSRQEMSPTKKEQIKSVSNDIINIIKPHHSGNEPDEPEPGPEKR